MQEVFIRKLFFVSVAVSLAACLSLMAVKPTLALTCPMPSIQKSYEKADWVFLAEVSEARNMYNEKDPVSHFSLQKLKLNVLKAWKGSPPEEMELETYTTSGVFSTARPNPLEVNKAYVFVLKEEQTAPPFAFRIGCESPWPASASEKEILWLNNSTGE